MPSGNVIAGRGSLRVDGVVYNCEKITLFTGGDKRESVVGMGGVAGLKVTPVVPRIEATIILPAAVRLSTILGWQDVTAEVECAGRSGTVEGASLTDPPTWDTAEGKCDVSLEGVSFTEAGV